MSSKPNLTDAAARQRIVTELDRSMLVEAGAGSGKTHMMAARMAAGIASGKYQIEHLAAVTFTRKAAAELRGRFQLALEERLSHGAVVGAGFSPPDDARVRAALSNLERFFAGTIHSFCARLLRERPVEAGVSPGFTELDDLEDRLLRRQSWRDYRSEARAHGDPDFELLFDAGIQAKHLDNAFEKVCLHEDVEFPAGTATMPDEVGVWKKLEAFWTALSQQLPAQLADDATCKTQQKARQFVRDWRMAGGGTRTPAQLVKLLELWSFAPNVVQRCWPSRAIALDVKELHSQFRTDVVEPYLTAWRQYVYGPCVRVLTKARAAAAHERRRRDTLSFNDLLLLTAKVLRTNTDVRRALQQKYRWIFVDEFQDTDPVQAEILMLLASADVDPGLQAWGQGALRPGALFVVGDPKQSIFRFTRADIDIYNEVRGRLAGPDGQGIVSLTTNFRSVPSLCDWANKVFESRFPTEPDTYAPKYAPLDAARADVGAARPDVGAGLRSRARQPGAPQGICTLTIPATTSQSDVPAEEAARIARFIRAEVDAGRRTYGDFLILTRRKSDRLKPYAEALEALQIPVEVTGAGAFGDSVEVRALGLLLRALADPQDSVSLIGVLRGSLFGLSDRQLFAHRQAGGWFSVYSLGPPTDPVVSALASLKEMSHWMRVLPAGAALDRILERTGYLALAATSPAGVEAGDLLHAIDRVRVVVEAGFSLLDAAEALDEDAEESSEVESLPLEPGRRDVARLMNLHKAKGLEAAVVFLADPCGGYDPRVDIRIVRGERDSEAVGYLEINAKVGDYGSKPVAEPPGWSAHEAEELKYLEAEAERLLYVAATRARDVLVVGRWAKPTGGTRAWDALNDALDQAIELKDIAAAVQPGLPLSAPHAADSPAPALAAIEAAHDRARRPSWSGASVTSEARVHAAGGKPDADIVAADPTDPTRVISADTPSRRADAGAAWGTMIHGLLEHAMRHKSATRDDLRRLAMWLTVEEPQLRAVIDEALDTVTAVAGADFWATARASSECHEEAPFSVRDDAGLVPKVVSGTIDLVYRRESDWHVIDYKTDADGAVVDLRLRYTAQIAAYERAWGRLGAAPVSTRIVGARREG